MQFRVMYAEGLGVEQDNNKAFEWYLKTKAQDNDDAPISFRCDVF
jgi:TPR repeat protein